MTKISPLCSVMMYISIHQHMRERNLLKSTNMCICSRKRLRTCCLDKDIGTKTWISSSDPIIQATIQSRRFELLDHTTPLDIQERQCMLNVLCATGPVQAAVTLITRVPMRKSSERREATLRTTTMTRPTSSRVYRNVATTGRTMTLLTTPVMRTIGKVIGKIKKLVAHNTNEAHKVKNENSTITISKGNSYCR